MRHLLLPLLLLTVAGVIRLPAQTYHDEAYLTGGHRSLGVTEPGLRGGLWLLRSDGSATTMALPSYDHPSFCMDVDNRHIVVGCSGRASFPFAPPMWGIYRLDPSTMRFTTIYGPNTILCDTVNRVLVDQNGDYVFSVAARYAVGTTMYRYEPMVLKTTPGGTLTTLLTSTRLGRPTWWLRSMCRDIDTGNLLIHDDFVGSVGAVQYRNPVIELKPDGTSAHWKVYGDRFGFWRRYAMPQDHRTGHLTGIWNGGAYETCRDPGPCHKLYHLTYSLNTDCFRLDLQTAPRQRWVGAPFTGALGINTHRIAYVDPQSRTITSLTVSALGTMRVSTNDFRFYRGRHVQTVRTGAHRWDIRLSCPRSPGAPYVLAAGLSGVRPAIQLADGRRINLNPDQLTAATLQNALPGIWNPGPGVLDANGEARGVLDIGRLGPPSGGFKLPIWIALAVLDPKSPSGIKYLPDTYVMRI